MDKLISQQAAIDKIKKRLFETAFNNVGIKQNIDETLVDVAENRLESWFDEMPSVQPELKELSEWKADFKGYINALNMPKDDYDGIMEYIDEVPSAQTEIIRCKDCKHSRFFDPCFYCYEMGREIIVPENGFCFKAERREDETD